MRISFPLSLEVSLIVCHGQPPELALMFSKYYFGAKPVPNNVGKVDRPLYHSGNGFASTSANHFRRLTVVGPFLALAGRRKTHHL